MKRGILLALTAASALLLVGFAAFVAYAVVERRPSLPEADGVVVLTGGEDRIAVAIGLLQQGMGRRLLISGVNPRTSAEAIGRQTGQRAELFRCCIDIGREASDTVGNAEEARDWARARGFRSLIVVTSSYHMPRALSEFARAMPGVTLRAHPVVSRSLKQHPWWGSVGTIRLLASEYLKFVASATRLALASLLSFFDGTHRAPERAGTVGLDVASISRSAG